MKKKSLLWFLAIAILASLAFFIGYMFGDGKITSKPGSTPKTGTETTDVSASGSSALETGGTVIVTPRAADGSASVQVGVSDAFALGMIQKNLPSNSIANLTGLAFSQDKGVSVSGTMNLREAAKMTDMAANEIVAYAIGFLPENADFNASAALSVDTDGNIVVKPEELVVMGLTLPVALIPQSYIDSAVASIGIPYKFKSITVSDGWIEAIG